MVTKSFKKLKAIKVNRMKNCFPNCLTIYETCVMLSTTNGQKISTPLVKPYFAYTACCIVKLCLIKILHCFLYYVITVFLLFRPFFEIHFFCVSKSAIAILYYHSQFDREITKHSEHIFNPQG